MLVELPCFASPTLEFYREDLHFKLSADHFSVDGYYYFRNPTDKPLNTLLAYPFPADSLMGTVDSVFAYDSNNKNIMLQNNQKFMNFRVSIPAQDTLVCRIGYRQELKEHYAKYILLTTHAWGKPFEQVNYDLTTTMKIKEFSYEPDRIFNKKKITNYTWHKVNFMPDRDFVIRY